ncbi:hypothetical protein O0L34_g6171 [Tuta absoluta]|nr:hypothetical protein O0L34_g6171 [Tuta absoluta]
MFTIIVLVIYGITVGYHYAQKELASFAMSSRSTTETTLLRSGEQPENRPVVRMLAVNRTEIEGAPAPILEVFQTRRPGQSIYMEASETPIVLLETERPPQRPQLSRHEKELARKLIGRFRRSRNNVTSSTPFFKPIKNSTIL